MKLLKEGKVKKVFIVNDKELEFLFTNNISVFDKVIPSQIPYKGETLCRTSAYWFECLKAHGIRNHFIRLVAPNRMRVKRVKVVELGKLNLTKSYFIPLEVVCRWYVAGSLFDRIKKGKINADELGFSSGHKIKYGDELPQPFIEFTTKLEKTDRELTNEEALKLSGLTSEELEKLKQIVITIDKLIAKKVEKNGLIHVDGKKEFAMDEHRELMVIDAFGTADEDRFWDKEMYENGKCVELSKEYVRQYYKKIGYKDQLYDARKKGLPEPAIPPLPHNLIKQTSQLYINLFERLTGQKFR